MKPKTTSRMLRRQKRCIQLGAFLVSLLGRRKVWIQHRAGEGLETTQTKLEAALRAFFHKEF